MQSNKARRISVVRRGYNAAITSTSFREGIEGPEREVVRQLLKSFVVPENCRAVMFVEPKIETGFPDVVVVLVDRIRLRNWSAKRAQLKANDFRLLHFIFEMGPLSKEKIDITYGRDMEKTLRALESAQLISCGKKGLWRTLPIKKVFAATDLIAFEAKVNEWGRVIKQALLNTWFASKSIILVPDENQGRLLAKRVIDMPLGVWSVSPTLKRPVRGVRASLPRSYVSWLLCEWACRVLKT